MNNYDVCEKILYTQEEIDAAVKRIAAKITQDYADKEDVAFVSVLNGAFIFVADLVRNVKLDCTIDFMKVSTYDNGTTTTGNFKIKKDVSNDIAGKNVIIVEDILDTGFTLHNLITYLQLKNPASIKIATFIDKPARRKNTIDADYVCFTMDSDYFIVGYGLDYAQKYRNLPYVGVLKEHLH